MLENILKTSERLKGNSLSGNIRWCLDLERAYINKTPCCIFAKYEQNSGITHPWLQA